MLRKYSDKNGGLIVEKTEPSDNISVAKQSLVRNQSTISAADAIDTMQSYQTGNLSVLDSSEKGTCAFCGNITAFKNRHVCLNCWKENSREIIDGLKTAVKDVEIKID